MPIAVSTSSGSSPSEYPLLSSELKTQLRITHSDEDTHLSLLIQAADENARQFLGRSLITRAYTWTFDAFPAGDEALYVPYPPLIAISSIQYIDTDGTTQTFGSTYYSADVRSVPGRILLAYNEDWPSDVQTQPNAVTIKFTAGYGSSAGSIPASLRLGLYEMVASWYENRQDYGSRPVYAIPGASASKLEPYRVWDFEGV